MLGKDIMLIFNRDNLQKSKDSHLDSAKVYCGGLKVWCLLWFIDLEILVVDKIRMLSFNNYSLVISSR